MLALGADSWERWWRAVPSRRDFSWTSPAPNVSPYLLRKQTTRLSAVWACPLTRLVIYVPLSLRWFHNHHVLAEVSSSTWGGIHEDGAPPPRGTDLVLSWRRWVNSERCGAPPIGFPSPLVVGLNIWSVVVQQVILIYVFLIILRN